MLTAHRCPCGGSARKMATSSALCGSEACQNRRHSVQAKKSGSSPFPAQKSRFQSNAKEKGAIHAAHSHGFEVLRLCQSKGPANCFAGPVS